jgi:hypothetical protein
MVLIKYLNGIFYGLFIPVVLLLSPLFLLNIYADEIDVRAKETSESYELEQEMIADRQAQQEDNNFSSEIDSYLRYIPSRSSATQSGKIRITQSGIEYSYDFKAFGELPVELSLNPEYININNSTPVKLPTFLTKLSAGFNATAPLFDIKGTYFYMELNPSFYGDNWDFGPSNFYFESRYTIIYQPNERLSLVAGLDVNPVHRYPFLSVFNTYPVSPVLGFIYKPNDKLMFNILPDTPNISYTLTDRVTLFIQENDSLERYYVTKDNAETKLNYSQLYLSAGLKFKINKFIETSLAMGNSFRQILKYTDTAGKVTTRNGLFAEFRIEVKI